MKKQKSTTKEDLIPVNSDLQKSLDVINSLKAQVDTVGNQLLQIQVVDESTLAICQQNLSKAHSVVKTIEEKRVELKAPFLDAGKQIDNLCKSIVEVANKGIVHAKEEVAKWERKRQEEARKAQEEIDRKAKEEADRIAAEEARKKKITDYISLEMTPYFQSKYASLKTAQECDEFLDYIKTKFPGAEKFQEFLNDALRVRDNYIGLIEAKKAQLSAADNLSEVEKVILKEKEEIARMKQELAAKELEIKQREEEAETERKRKEAEALAEQEKARLQAQSDLEKTKNVRSLWKFEVVDEEKIPRDWMVLDESKVKEYLKEHKDNLVSGYVINGIKFYKEISIVA